MMQDEPRVGEELEKMSVEPLLPIEKKLVAGSLALGAVLLAVLIFVSRVYFPIAS